MTKEIVWVWVNTTSVRQAREIGQAVLKKRLAACYSLVKKIESVYFWPPLASVLEKNTGPNIIFDTLPSRVNELSKLVKKLHSDKLPFIGQIKIKVEDPFYQWVKNEIK